MYCRLNSEEASTAVNSRKKANPEKYKSENIPTRYAKYLRRGVSIIELCVAMISKLTIMAPIQNEWSSAAATAEITCVSKISGMVVIFELVNNVLDLLKLPGSRFITTQSTDYKLGR